MAPSFTVAATDRILDGAVTPYEAPDLSPQLVELDPAKVAAAQAACDANGWNAANGGDYAIYAVERAGDLVEAIFTGTAGQTVTFTTPTCECRGGGVDLPRWCLVTVVGRRHLTTVQIAPEPPEAASHTDPEPATVPSAAYCPAGRLL